MLLYQANNTHTVLCYEQLIITLILVVVFLLFSFNNFYNIMHISNSKVCSMFDGKLFAVLMGIHIVATQK